MLPYIDIAPIALGPLTLQPFGMLVAAGCYIGYLMGRRHSQQVGLDPETYRRLMLCTLVCGFLGSYWVAILAYHPERLAGILRHPWRLFAIASSMSSYGGFLGGTLGAFVYFRMGYIAAAGLLVLVVVISICLALSKPLKRHHG